MFLPSQISDNPFSLSIKISSHSILKDWFGRTHLSLINLKRFSAPREKCLYMMRKISDSFRVGKCLECLNLDRNRMVKNIYVSNV